MIVHESDGTCPGCGGPLGIGLKEEPTGWKVYRVCLADDRRPDGRRCVDERVGTVSRSNVDDYDDVFARASALVRR